MQPPRAADLRRAGFTILELAIALALITVASVIAIPAFYSQPNITLDNASLLLARDLRYAQNEAAMRGVHTQVTFDTFGDGYAVETSDAMPLPNPVGGGDLVRVYSRDAIFEGVTITAINGLTEPHVRFDKNGFALDGVAIEMHYEQEVRTVHLARESGLMEIEGLTTRWKDDGL